jgi:hypothetical protein
MDALAARAAADPAVRSKTGVLIEIDRKGAPEFDLLLYRPGEIGGVEGATNETSEDESDETADAPRADRQTPPSALVDDKPRIPYALKEALGLTLTAAVAKRLKDEPAIAMAALIASIWTSRYTWEPAPVRVSATKAPTLSTDRESAQTWSSYFHALLAVPDRLASMTAPMIADLIDVGDRRYDDRNDWRGKRGDMIAALADALGEQLRPALVEAFDAEAYFTGVTIAECKASLAEMGFAGAVPAGKAAIAAVCAKEAREKAWLPIELRVSDNGGRT